MTLETGLTLAVITLTPIAVIREFANGEMASGKWGQCAKIDRIRELDGVAVRTN